MNENWHVVTVSHGGTVSIIRNVTKEQAEEIREKLVPFHEGIYCLSDGTITDVHILGPK